MKTILSFLLLGIALVFAQDYSGTFVQQDDPSTTISFRVQDEGYVGLLINGGTDEFPLEAIPQENYLIGLLNGEAVGYEDLFFIAQFLQDGTLGLTIAPLNEQGEPIESEALDYLFLRSAEQASPKTAPQTNPLATAPKTASGNPLASQQDMFSGDYEGQAFNLSLKTDGLGYSGAIFLQGQTYPLEAQASGASLSGYFVADNQRYDFQGELKGSELRLLSGGESYMLTKVSEKPTDPASLSTPTSPLPSGHSSQEGTILASGQAFPEGTSLFSPWTGVTFKIPENHTGYFDEDLEVFVMMTQDSSSILVIEAASMARAEDLGYYAINALAEVLSPQNPEFSFVSGPELRGDSITASFVIDDSVYSAAAKQGVAGNAAVVIAYGVQAEQLASSVSQSIEFATPNGDVNIWKQKLAGFHLSGGSSSSSYDPGNFGDDVSQAGSAKFIYDFCSDGSYRHEYNNVSYVSVSDEAENYGGSGMMLASIKTGGQGSYVGTWDMVSLLMGNPLLVLESNQGELFLHSIWETEKGAALDNRAYQVSQSRLCE